MENNLAYRTKKHRFHFYRRTARDSVINLLPIQVDLTIQHNPCFKSLSPDYSFFLFKDCFLADTKFNDLLVKQPLLLCILA